MGPQYFKDVKAPLPPVRLMPTGGVDAGNADLRERGLDILEVLETRSISRSDAILTGS